MQLSARSPVVVDHRYKGVIFWDIDKTLIDTDLLLLDVFPKNLAKFLGKSLEETIELSHQTYYAHGCSIAPFMQERGLHPQGTLDFYREASEAVYARRHELILCPELPQLLDSLTSDDWLQGIITQGHSHYAQWMVDLMQIRSSLHPHLIVGLDDAQAGLKRHGHPYKAAWQRLEFVHHNQPRWMVEDSPANLIPLKHELAHKCIGTALVGERELTPEQAACVDERHPRVHEFALARLGNVNQTDRAIQAAE
ncbi:MAG: HAD hydrolase-like protein [Alphaproteobacteria bacterium]